MRKPPWRNARLEVVEAAERLRAEQLAVALVEAAQHRHPESLARETDRIAGLERLLEQLGDVALAHADVLALDAHDELLRRGHDRELDRARNDLAQPRVALEPRDVGLLLPQNCDAVDELGHGALLDRLLAERRQDLGDVLHERRVRADDEDAPQLLAIACKAATTRDEGRPPSCRCRGRPARRARRRARP